MKISPTEIRKKSFETSFRGYEKKEVEQFLDQLSQSFDQVCQENLELKSKLQQVESEAKRLKDVEDSLFRTLKTAEDTGASIIEEANAAADQIIEEANYNAKHANEYAEKIIKEAKQKAESDAAIIIGAAESKAKEVIVELRESMQGLVRSYESLVEQRENLVKSLRRISQDMLNQIDLSDAHFSRIDAKAHARAVEELSRSQAFTFGNLASLAEQVGQSLSQTEIVVEEEEQDPMAEMEVIEEELEIEIHDSTPDVQAEVSEVESEEQIEEEEVEEEETKVKNEAPSVSEEETESPKKEDPNKQSGSFFDQFD
ncbi:DivIVA domain-containing protein [Algoriphagus kandeliae]|uniref:DivIVA domain-containing protein n=1 Tax=Algoriphagus kandeliae TaxID=2562278 RepID=A0A4Y9QNI4_9BACT|nr:DivIVA domain-containing protein [Algoriphagus kandeliae]TFV94211.1 DivIVA domain-containing protein [Algoriphagus kandeliae]